MSQFAFTTNLSLLSYSVLNNQLYSLLYNLPAPATLQYYNVFPLPNGLSSIEFRLSANDFIFDKINNYINKLAFSPISCSISTSFPLSTDAHYNLELAFSKLLYQLYKIPVDYVDIYTQIVNDNYITNFIPYTNENHFIYYDPRSSFNFSHHLDLKKLIGYQYLKDDTLGAYALDENIKYNLLSKHCQYTQILGLTFVKITEDLVTNIDAYDMMVDSVQNLRKRGFFSYSDFNNLDIIKEIVHFWPITIVKSDPDFDIVLQVKDDVDFFVSAENWLDNAIKSIKSGNVPRFRFSGKWVYAEKNPYIALVGDSQARALETFGAYFAYSILCLEAVELQNYLPMVKVYADLSVEINVSSYTEAMKFKTLYFSYMKNIDGFTLIPCFSFKECVQYRYYVRDNYPNLLSVIANVANSWYVYVNTTTTDSFELTESFQDIDIKNEKQLFGFYDFDGISGLINSPAALTTESGTVMAKVTNGLATVMIDTVPLLEIETGNLQPVLDSVDQLFHDGEMMNPWAWFVYQNLGKMSVNFKIDI